LTGTVASVDVSTKQNLDKLVFIGERLLKKPVSRVNMETGLSEPIPNGGTNEEALKKYGRTHTCTITCHYILFIITHLIINIYHGTNVTKLLVITGLQKYFHKKGCFERQNHHSRKSTSNADYSSSVQALHQIITSCLYV
jgi:hypothetical protein